MSVVFLSCVFLLQCFSSTDTARDYRGCVYWGVNQEVCSNWLDVLDKEQRVLYLSDGIGNHSYCRNPGGFERWPWCYWKQNPTVRVRCEISRNDYGDTGCDVKYIPIEPHSQPPVNNKTPEAGKQEGCNEGECLGYCSKNFLSCGFLGLAGFVVLALIGAMFMYLHTDYRKVKPAKRQKKMEPLYEERCMVLPTQMVEFSLPTGTSNTLLPTARQDQQDDR